MVFPNFDFTKKIISSAVGGKNFRSGKKTTALRDVTKILSVDPKFQFFVSLKSSVGKPLVFQRLDLIKEIRKWVEM